MANFFNASWPLTSKRLIQNNFSNTDGPFLFISNSWNQDGEVSGASFFLCNSNYQVLLAGACPLVADSSMEAELKTINIAILAILDNGFHLRDLFINIADVYNALNANITSHNWHLNQWIPEARQNILKAGSPFIHEIPKSWSSPAIALASFGANLHALTLYFQVPRS